MKKKVVIINGAGGVGKDTLIGFVSNAYDVSMASSITPVKIVAERAGWEGEKDKKARKFLSDLKKVMTEYNDAPFDYCCGMLKGFLKTDEQILFVQIREPSEIARFKEYCLGYDEIDVFTLLIVRPRNTNGNSDEDSMKYGNTSDDNVSNYHYDLVYDNIYPLIESEKKFVDFFTRTIMEANK